MKDYKLDGKGTLYDQDDRIVYCGQYKSDKKHGQGVYYSKENTIKGGTVDDKTHV